MTGSEMGIVGAVLVARWSFGLIRQSSRVLLDWQAHTGTVNALRESIEGDSTDCVIELHAWGIGPELYQRKTLSRGNCSYTLTIGDFKPCQEFRGQFTQFRELSTKIVKR